MDPQLSWEIELEGRPEDFDAASVEPCQCLALHVAGSGAWSLDLGDGRVQARPY
jgi:hypothetical protein